MTLLWKLLRSHLSVAQTVGFALAGVVGMTIVLTSTLPPGSWRSWADSLSSGMSGLSRRRTTG